MRIERKDEGQVQKVYICDGMEVMCDGGEETTETLQQNGSEGSPETTGKTISIEGKSFTVSDDIANAYTQHTQGIDKRFEERSQELGALRQYYTDSESQKSTQQQAVPNNQEQSVDMGTLMYEDPTKFVESIDDKISKVKDDLRNEYQQNETTKQEEVSFWNSMWSENSDLAVRKDQSKEIIKMIGQKYSQHNLQNTKPVRDALATEARTFISGLVGDSISNSSDGFVEGSSAHTTQSNTKKKETPRRTTAEILNSGKEARRKAVVNKQ